MGQFSALALQFNFKYQKHSGHLCVNINVPTDAVPKRQQQQQLIHDTYFRRCTDAQIHTEMQRQIQMQILYLPRIDAHSFGISIDAGRNICPLFWQLIRQQGSDMRLLMQFKWQPDAGHSASQPERNASNAQSTATANKC